MNIELQFIKSIPEQIEYYLLPETFNKYLAECMNIYHEGFEEFYSELGITAEEHLLNSSKDYCEFVDRLKASNK